MPILLAGLCLATPRVASAAAVTNPLGPLRPYGTNDFFCRSDRVPTEGWYYEFQFESGHFVQVTFLRANLGVLPDVCGVQVWVMQEDTEPLSIGRQMPVELFREMRSGPRIELSTRNWIAGLPPARHELHVNIPKGNGIKLDLAFTNMVPGFVVGDGVTRLGKGGLMQVGLMVAIPRARVTGTLALGDRVTAVAGWAYAEHFWQPRSESKFMRRRWQARFSDSRHTVSINLFEVKGEHADTVVGHAYVADTERVLEVFPPAALERSAMALIEEDHIATRFAISQSTATCSYRAAWRRRELLQRFAMTQDMNRIAAGAMQLLGHERTFYRFVGDWTVEVDYGGDTRSLSGLGFHEITVPR